MRSIVYGGASAVCLTLFVACGKLTSTPPSLVGEWSEAGGQRMAFLGSGYVVWKDTEGNAISSAKYSYESGDGMVKIFLPGKTIEGRCVSKKWLQLTSAKGRKHLLSRREKNAAPAAPATPAAKPEPPAEPTISTN